MGSHYGDIDFLTRWYTMIVRHSTVQRGVLHFRLRVAIAQPFRDSVTRALVLNVSKPLLVGGKYALNLR